MRLLLDTCTFLWLAQNHRSLSATAMAACQDRSNAVHLSALTVWEISIKHRLGHLPLPENPASFVVKYRQTLDLAPLAFDERSAAIDSALPPHHRDPFDRGLVCQALHHGMLIVTPDRMISKYPAATLW